MYSPIRWQQRFQNFDKAMIRLERAIKRYQEASDDELILEGLVQTYEFTYELGLNTLRDYLRAEGSLEQIGAKNTIRQALQFGIIQDGHTWMQAIADRNLTSHTYNETAALEVVEGIQERYFDLLKSLYEFFKKEISDG